MEGKKLEIMELSSCEKLILGCIYSYEQKTKKRPELKVLMQWTSEKHGRNWKPQTVCTFISRMEKKGYIESFSGNETNGKKRTYYQITAAGNDYFQQKCAEWEVTKEVIDRFAVYREGGHDAYH